MSLIVHTGTPGIATFTAAGFLSFTVSPTPTPGNGLAIVLSSGRITSNTANVPVCTDNQGNVWHLLVQSQNLASVNNVQAVIFFCQSVAVTGSLIVTITGTSGGRASYIATPVETVAGLSVDRTGTYSSGASSVGAATVTAAAANAHATSLVLAGLTVYNSAADVNTGTAPGYTSIEHAQFSTSTYISCDQGVKDVTSIETSSAVWSGFSNGGIAAAAIATLNVASGSPPYPYSIRRRRISTSYYPR